MNNPTPTSAICPPRCNACGLRKTGAFMPVNAEELLFIEAFRTGTTAVRAGGTILYEQKPNGKLFTLYSGWAFRYKTLSDGRRQILNFLLPGDFIGLQQKFADGAMHGIEAVTDTSLCVFPRDGLWELFRGFPNLGYDITWLAAREEGMVDDHLLTAGRRNATERVAMLLMHLFRRLERVGMAEGGVIDFPHQPAAHRRRAGPVAGAHQQDPAAPAPAGAARHPGRQAAACSTPRALERIADYYDTPPPQVPLALDSETSV
jgi:CRP/FNR family transcriptional regulator